MGNIFISYRRKDWTFAQRLAEHLDARMPTARVFIDIRIQEDDFKDTILKEIKRCDVFILVVSERTFEETRINSETDWIRLEIKEALRYHKPVVLAGIEDLKIPDNLPTDIQLISQKQGIIFYPQFFNEGVYQIAEHCRKVAKGAFTVEEGLVGIHPAKPVTVEQTGIIITYDNLDNCREAMRNDFLLAKNVRLLLQLGRKEIGNGNQSFFFETAKEKAKQSEHQIRILHVSQNSPFLSPKRAEHRRSTSYDEWMLAITQLKQHINILNRNYRIQIEAREHQEPFLWRIFLFDDVAYISGYLFGRHNDKHAVVHKVAKGKNSLFGVFDNYFEYLWEKGNPNDVLSPEDKWAKW